MEGQICRQQTVKEELKWNILFLKLQNLYYTSFELVFFWLIFCSVLIVPDTVCDKYSVAIWGLLNDLPLEDNPLRQEGQDLHLAWVEKPFYILPGAKLPNIMLQENPSMGEGTRVVNMAFSNKETSLNRYFFEAKYS